MVTVVGLGFVGLTTALGLAEYGHEVYGIEANPERLATITSGKLPFQEPELDEALARHLDHNFIPTDNWDEAVANSEAIIYCVGTPYGEDGNADLTYLYGAIDQTLAAIHDDKFRVLVVKSTIPPSTTERRIIPYLEERGWDVPERIGVANNPEFLREGHCWEDFMQADRVVLGVSDPLSEQILQDLYTNSGVPVFAVSLNTGEFIKYLSNTSLACLISFANEMATAAERIGEIDVAQAFRILHMDDRWQNGGIRAYFYPGCGYGGYCLPKDTNAFYALARDMGTDMPMLEATIATNDDMAEVTARKIISAAKNNKDSRIGILGLSFNVGSDDVRDAPSAKIIHKLNKAGYCNIVGYDPVAREQFEHAYPNLNCTYKDSCNALLAEVDVAAITTAWPEFRDIPQHCNKSIVDCRYML